MCTCRYVCVHATHMHVEGRGCVPCLVQLFYLYFWGGAFHWVWFIDWASLVSQGTPQLCLLSTEMTAECPHAWFLQGCWGLNSVPRVYLSLDLISQRFCHLHLAHWIPGFLYMNFWGLIQTTFNPEQRVYNGVVTLPGKVLGLGDGSGLRTHTAPAEDHFW